MTPDLTADYDILLVEDTASMRTIYEAHLRRAGYRTLSAATSAEAWALFQAHTVSVVLLDLMLPDRDGLDLLMDLVALRPAVSVVVVAAERSVDRTVTAIRRGARDFLVKPVEEHRLMEAVAAARVATALAQPAGGHIQSLLQDFVGLSPSMRQVYETIRAAARSNAPVCIEGETGTGKEMAALAIHRLSERSSGPFVTLDCGAISPDRFEAEVFGNRRLAFSAAPSDSFGAAELADGGTLFLDEIAELPATVQPKLLRFLQSGLVQPLGGDGARRVNLRIICASSMPMHEALGRGRLRADLYYRLNVLRLPMPPLRERIEDIAALAETFLHRFAALEGRSPKRLEAGALQRLQSHPWPGNVRELSNVLRAAVVMLEDEVLSAEMLAPLLHDTAKPKAQDILPDMAQLTLAELERQTIEAALARHDGSVPRAAHDLGVAPSTLYRKLEGWRKA